MTSSSRAHILHGLLPVLFLLACAPQEPPPAQQRPGRPASTPHGPGLFFLEPLHYSLPACDIGSLSRRVIAADVDGDTHLDLVNVDFLCLFMTVAYGYGDGTFEPPRLLTLGRPFRKPIRASPNISESQLCAADFDQDGVTDLAFNVVVGAALLFGQKERRLRAEQGITIDTPEGILALASADFDRDGRPDLVAGDAKNGVSLVRNQGLDNGWIRFTSAQRFPSNLSAERIAVADLNRDGLPDLMTRTVYEETDPKSSTQVTLWINQGQGRLSAKPTLTFPESLGGLTAADLDGDGIVDLIVSYMERAGAAWLRGRTDGTYDAPKAIPTHDKAVTLESITITDLDGDGKQDLVFPSLEGISIVKGQGGGAFALVSPPLTVPEGYSDTAHVVVADFDHDGRPDIAATGLRRLNDLFIFLNDTHR